LNDNIDFSVDLEDIDLLGIYAMGALVFATFASLGIYALAVYVL
jgi:hypothetical protein